MKNRYVYRMAAGFLFFAQVLYAFKGYYQSVCDESLNSDAAGVIKTPNGDGVEEVVVALVYPGPFMPPMPTYDLTDGNGEYLLQNVPYDFGFKVAPDKIDNPLNGVTTYDLVLIAKHILGTVPFDSPYKFIAADINQSGSISTFDVVEARKLILGIYTSFPNNHSWRFVRKSYVFPNPGNPFQEAFPEDYTLVSNLPGGLDMDFVGVKIGDVNYSAVPNLLENQIGRSNQITGFKLRDREVQAGEVFELQFTAAEALEAFQFTLLLNGLKAVQVVESENVTAGDFNLKPKNAVAVSINGAQGFTLRFRAEKAGRLSEMLQIGSDITRAEAYDKKGSALKPVLQFMPGITATFQTPDCANQNWTKTNDAQLWNESYWLDKNFSKHDLCEQPVDLSITISDSCAGLQVSCLLFLDLDGNDTLETVVHSDEMGAGGLGWNQIRYNNINTPNYSGGELRAFDERQVMPLEKFGFALEEIANGNGKTANIRFNTEADPDAYYPVQLPLGKYKIVWSVSDFCGNQEEYTYEFRVKDCQAPVVNCLNYQLSVNIMPTGMITLWASDFLQSTYDNCTPDGDIIIGVRKCGTGTGFPFNANGQPQTSVTFTCPEYGQQCVELWSRDFAGNAGYCQVSVIVQDNFGNCAEPPLNYFSGTVKTPLSEGILEAKVIADITNPIVPPYVFTGSDLTNGNGDYVIDNLPLPTTATLRVEKDDNILNGVTTYDLVLISKHILGIQPFDSPFKIIAADANKSGSVTSFDMVELRKLILGINTQLANNHSWRFIDKAFVFPNPANPFQTAFPETIALSNITGLIPGLDFTGIKVGDVNDSAVPDAQSSPMERFVRSVEFNLSDRAVQAGETFEVKCTASEPLDGFRFTFLLNGLKVIQVIENENVTVGNFNLSLENAVAVSINGAQDFTLRFQAEKAGLLSEMLRLGEGVTRAEAYGREGLMTPVLRFDGRVGQTRTFELYAAQPNPFSMQTTISFYLPEASDVGLSVFDVTGRLLYSREAWLEAGEQQIILDKKRFHMDSGQGYYLLRAGRDAAVQKIAWFVP